MSIPRVLAGNRPNGAAGLFISMPGHDVKTCDPGYLMFDMGTSMMRLLAQGSFTFQPNTGGQTITVPYSSNGTLPYGVFFDMLRVNTGAQAAQHLNFVNISMSTSAISATITTSLNYSVTVFYTLFQV